jgi:hypothetical protein
MRPGVTWVIVGAVAVIVVFAGLDALRSAGGEPASTETNATEAVTTVQADTGAQIESSASLIDEQLVRLIPGRVRTDRDWPAFDSFTVPPGWYGHQRGASYVIGNELKDQAVTWRWGGISVEPLANRFSRSLADAAGAFEKLRDIRIEHVSPIHIGGNSGRKYVLALDKSVPRPLGANAMLGPGGADVILLDVPGRETNTLIIRWGFNDDRERVEVERVLMTLEFYRPPPPKKQIERLGNRWARLFGAGRRCNQLMGQPLCQRINCERVGGRPIANCTPVSSEVQRSFAGAVVRGIVIRGRHAAAKFSNGETVRFTKSPVDQVWFIERVGAGDKLFE